ncbi:MAG: thiamine pyrophosphate-binding protein [Chloroflexi bacterium]|nr:thiamine pyrophosphate-binding protein [Chloroflexota bacterium]
MASQPEVPLGMRELYPYPAMYIADVLKEHNVEIAFGVHGGHIWQIIDGMSTAGIKTVTVRHEQTAVYAAEAYAKVTGKPGLAFATVGPGTANIVSAVQQAFISKSPVIVLLGGHEIQVDRLYTTIQESYAPDLMNGITKWTQRVTHPSQYKQFVTRAFKEAMSYPRGPVVLEFSLDGLWTPIPPAVRPTFFGEHSKYRPGWLEGDIDRPLSGGADPALLEKVIDRIYQAERPLLYGGDGIHWSKAAPELQEFAELSQIPVTNRRIARGAVPENHPLSFPPRAGKGLLKASDLLVTFGMKVGFFEGYGDGWPKVVQIAESTEHIWTFLATTEAVIGNPKIVLRQMIDIVKKRKLSPPAGRQAWVAKAQAEAKSSTDRLNARAEKYRSNNPIHHGWLSKCIAETMEELYDGKNRVMVDGFTISDYCPPFLRPRYSGQIMDASEQAGIGHGIGMSIGAAFGDPECRKRPVLALMGDAGIGIGGMDIETALRFKLPIVYLITNNNGWMTSVKYAYYGKDWQAMGPQDHGYGHEFIPGIRYDKMFEVVGCHGEHVVAPDEIKPALVRAFRAAEKGKTAVVNIVVDPSIANGSLYSFAYVLCSQHIPWAKLAKRGKAARRNLMRWLPWDKAGVPAMPMPDTWEPVKEDEALP